MKTYLCFIPPAMRCLSMFFLLMLPLHAEENQSVKKASANKSEQAKPSEKKVSVKRKPGEIDLLALLKRTKPVFYPECKPLPVRVGLEDFGDKLMTLSGLEGVYLNVEGLLESAGKKKVQMVDGLKEKIIQRLAQGGLKLLTEEEMLITPGQPEMSMYMSFPAHLTPVKKGGKPLVYRPDCCTMGIWTSFSQAGKILRDPDTNYKLGTWGEGHNSTDCSDPGGWMSDVILQTVAGFAEAKLKGDKVYAALLKARKTEKPAPNVAAAVKPVLKVAQKAESRPKKAVKVVKTEKRPPLPEKVSLTQVPVECNGSVRMFIDMFETNQTRIDISQAYALQQLAESMIACPMYNYMIETHADPRSSLAYNEKLSALRAASIQSFLLGRGVAKDRFVMQSFGERNPITIGHTEQDYAANRRVVVRPYLAAR